MANCQRTPFSIRSGPRCFGVLWQSLEADNPARRTLRVIGKALRVHFVKELLNAALAQPDQVNFQTHKPYGSRQRRLNQIQLGTFHVDLDDVDGKLGRAERRLVPRDYRRG